MGAATFCVSWLSLAVLYWVISRFLDRPFLRKYHPHDQNTRPHHCSRQLFIQGHGSENLSIANGMETSTKILEPPALQSHPPPFPSSSLPPLYPRPLLFLSLLRCSCEVVQFSSVQSLVRFGRRRDTMDDSAEILFLSLLREAFVSSPGVGRGVHSMTLSFHYFLCQPRLCNFPLPPPQGSLKEWYPGEAVEARVFEGTLSSNN